MWRHTRSKRLLLLLACAINVGGVLFPALPVLAADTKIETNICGEFAAPSITEPAPHTTDDSSITVAGTGEPNMTVAIRNNGVTAGTSLIAGDGSYSLQIPLSVGDNVLVARTSNGCENKDSPSVTVHRNAPPEPPRPPHPSGPAGESGGSPVSPPVTSPSDSLGQSTPQPQLGDRVPSPLPKPTPGYMKPLITEPRNNEVFTAQTIWLAGEAAPYSVITIYVNNIAVATVTADGTGKFGASVQLRAGENKLQVRAALGKKVAFSDIVKVQLKSVSEVRNEWVSLLFLILLLIFLILLIILLYRERRRRDEA